jgi:hypothetical protein
MQRDEAKFSDLIRLFIPGFRTSTLERHGDAQHHSGATSLWGHISCTTAMEGR